MKKYKIDLIYHIGLSILGLIIGVLAMYCSWLLTGETILDILFNIMLLLTWVTMVGLVEPVLFRYIIEDCRNIKFLRHNEKRLRGKNNDR